MEGTEGPSSASNSGLLAQSICDTCRELESYVNETEDILGKETEGDLQLRIEPQIHQIALCTSSLFRHAKQWATGSDNAKPNLLIDLIYALAQKIRKASLEYIRSTKAFCSNRMDFLTSEKHQQAQQNFHRISLCMLKMSKIYLLQQANEPISAFDAHIAHLVTLADVLAVETRKTVVLASEEDPLVMLQKSSGFLNALSAFIDRVCESIDSETESETVKMTEKLRSYKNELIYLSQDATSNISQSTPRTQASLLQRRQGILHAILDQEIEVLVAYVYENRDNPEEAPVPVEKKPKQRSSRPELRESLRQGPRQPQRPSTCRIPSAQVKILKEAIANEMETQRDPRSDPPTRHKMQRPLKQVRNRRSIAPTPSIRNLGSMFKKAIAASSDNSRPSSTTPETSEEQSEQSEDSALNTRQKMALEATMATTVPIVIDLFGSRFPWFHKGWEKENPEMKRQFMLDMKNVLLKLKWYEEPESLPQHYPLPQQHSTGNLSDVSPELKKEGDKEESELQQFLVPMSTAVRWHHRSVSLSNVLEFQTVQDFLSYQETIKHHVHNMYTIVTEQFRNSPGKDSLQSLSQQASDLYHVYNSIVSMSSPSSTNQIVHQMAIPVKEAILAATTQGVEDSALLETLRASNNFSMIRNVGRNLLLQIREKLLSLQALGFQTICIIRSVGEQKEQRISHASTLQLIAIARRLVGTIESLLHHVATLDYIRLNFTSDRLAARFTSNLRNSTMEADVPMVRYVSEEPSEEETPALGTLNCLVCALTDPNNDEQGYQQAFVTLYETFCTSHLFFSKLRQRYEFSRPDEDLPAIRCRIISVLEEWIQRKYEDLDPTTRGNITEFIQQVLPKDGYVEEVERLSALLKQKEIELNHSLQEELQAIPEVIWEPSSQESLYQYFLSADETLIAQQLTIHDWNIFRRIRYSELMGQAWNKKKHCASNVLDHIQRLNHVSYWVPSLILWSEKLKERGSVLIKFVRIGEELLKLHNYNTLMGIVAGLNMSSVVRLKFTPTVLSDQQMKAMDDLINLMDPYKAYKNYREHIAEAPLPAIPYLGVYLTDLTFLEDGNPDTTKGKIFFTKRLRLSQVVEKVTRFQSVSYDLEPVEPLFSYLQELPGLDDDALYQLSLIREPRGAEISDIL